jgi:hypothetical protein
MLENTINLTDIEYKINKDELIIIENALLGIVNDRVEDNISYFDNIEVSQKNKYVHAVSYEMAKPYLQLEQISEPFSEKIGNKTDNNVEKIEDKSEKIGDNVEKIEDNVINNVINNVEKIDDNVTNNVDKIDDKGEETDNCPVKNSEIVGNIQTSIWKKFFTNGNGREIIYGNKSKECTYDVVFRVLKEMEKNITTIQEIKDQLVIEYQKQAQYLTQLMEIWTRDKKIGKIKAKSIDMNGVVKIIHSEDYFITEIDIWLLAVFYELPIILFCTLGLKLVKSVNKNSKISWISLLPIDMEKKSEQYYYYIRCPSEDNVSKSLPEYHLILPKFKLMENITILEQNKYSLVEFLRLVK